MKKLTIKMSYSGEKIKGQGVLSATLEQVGLIKDKCSEEFDVLINKRGKHDILHIHTVNPRSFIGAKYSKAPVITHVHFLPETLEGSIKLPKLFMKVFSNYFLKLYRNSDHLVVVNPSFIPELMKYDIPEEQITYIPNFVSELDFYKYDSEKTKEAKAKFGYQADDFLVIGVGQVQMRKGVLDFVEVAKSLPHIQFAWAGGFSFGKITDGYKELTKAMENPPANVKFLGIIDREEMTDIYNAADLFFMPSYNELFPMAILESCSCETPILVRDLALFEPVLLDDYLIGSTNEEFITIIDKLHKDEAYYQKAVDHALSIKNYYSRDNVKTLWIEFYRNLYNSHQAKRDAKKKKKK